MRVTEVSTKPDAPRILTYREAVREALEIELSRDPNTILMGEDIGHYGGIYKVTTGLFDKFGPARVLDTPSSEAAFIGAAVGAAMTGKRPIAEIMFIDFALVASDQMLNQAGKMRFLSGDTFRVPLTIRTQQGLGAGTGRSDRRSRRRLDTTPSGRRCGDSDVRRGIPAAPVVEAHHLDRLPEARARRLYEMVDPTVLSDPADRGYPAQFEQDPAASTGAAHPSSASTTARSSRTCSAFRPSRSTSSTSRASSARTPLPPPPGDRVTCKRARATPTKTGSPQARLV